jgi:aspartyl protease family protein
MSSSSQTAEVVYLLAILVFVASAFFVRRIPLSQGIRMLGAWVLIFGVAFMLFQLRAPVSAFFYRLMEDRAAETTGLQAGEELHIRQALDGHFWVEALVNETKVRFPVDSGATTTSISMETARDAGVAPSNDFPVLVQTANGAIQVQRGRVDNLKVGAITREDLPVHMSQAFGDMNVLGMNFLSSLRSWRVEGQTLILQP